MAATLAPPTRELNPKQKAFVREYLKDFNGSQAAIRAGYAPNNVNTIAANLLVKVNVQDAIAVLVARSTAKWELSKDRIYRETARLAYLDPREFFHEDGRLKKPRDWPPDSAPCVASYDGKKKTISFVSKTQALLLAAKMMKLIDNAPPAPVTPEDGTYVVFCPSEASPEQWVSAAVAHVKKVPTLIGSNVTHDANRST